MENDFEFCIECGNKIDKGLSFCPMCGARIPEEENPPPYRGQYGPQQYFSPRKKSNTPLIIVLSLIVVLIFTVGGYFGLKALQGKLSGGSTVTNKDTTAVDNSSSKTAGQNKNSSDKTTSQGSGNQQNQKDKPTGNNSTGSKDPTTNKETSIPQSSKDPSAYLPKPYMKYTYDCWYQDGTSGKTNVVTGIIPGFSLVTSVELIEQSEPFTQHYVDGPEGVYVFSDEEFNKRSSLWLPFNAKAGQSWNNEGVIWKVIQLGAKCDLGNMKFDNCLAVEANYGEVGVICVCYIAPGYGTVLINDKASGKPRMKLLSTTPLSEKEANDIVKRYSPNAK